MKIMKYMKIIYCDKQSSFETLLENDDLFLYAIEIFRYLQLKYKMNNDLSPLIVAELFEQRNEQH